jgi:phosphatidylserine/phosphatidylglycerophosphate/cardiolipin synthase-like enzyme
MIRMLNRTIHMNIKEELLKYLETASKSIYVAVAWFTDGDLFELLCMKAWEGCEVKVILHDDSREAKPINFSPSGLPFINLILAGGQVRLLKGHHNKYCIIDELISISGSYNWTYGASNKKNGYESIDVSDDLNITSPKLAAFNQLNKEAIFLDTRDYSDIIAKVNLTQYLVKEITALRINLYKISLIHNSGKIALKAYMGIADFERQAKLNSSTKSIFRKNDDGTWSPTNNACLQIFQNMAWIIAKRKITNSDLGNDLNVEIVFKRKEKHI